MRELFEAHGLAYHTAPLPRRVFGAWHKVSRLSLPDARQSRRGRRRSPGPVAGPDPSHY